MPKSLSNGKSKKSLGETGLAPTLHEKLAIGAIVAGGVAVIGGAVTYIMASRRRTSALHDTLGRVQSRVKAGGMTLTHHYDPDMPIEKRIGYLQDLVYKGVHNPEMRELALAITGNGTSNVKVGKKNYNVRGANCPARNGLCEAEAIYRWTKANIRYSGDVAPIMHPDGSIEGVDLFQSGQRTAGTFKAGDCLPLDTKVLRDDYNIVALADVKPGDRIHGDGQWTTVQDIWPTGEKTLLEFELSNKSILRCTPEHRLFRRAKYGQVEEIRASEARPGDDLIQGGKISLAEVDHTEWPSVANALTDAEKAWLLGIYIADGWSDNHGQHRFFISGLTGARKEAQKKIVENLMFKLGVHTRMHQKYIAINDPTLGKFFAAMGKHATLKKLPSLAYTSMSQVDALLQGLAADADIRDGVFGTTSHELALQLRILHKMRGQSVSIKRVDDHGGLGKNPIYRITPRSTDNNRLDIKFNRIRSIRRAERPELCVDLTTDTGKFWLVETDTLVHNCDDHSVLNATLLALNGIPSQFRITAPSRSAEWQHIYNIFSGDKTNPNPKKWIPLDTTLPSSNMFGREAPSGKQKDFPI